MSNKKEQPNIDSYLYDIKLVKFIWLLLTNKFFRSLFKSAFCYALNSYDKNRGNGASDVLIFDKQFKHLIFKRNDREPITSETWWKNVRKQHEINQKRKQ